MSVFSRLQQRIVQLLPRSAQKTKSGDSNLNQAIPPLFEQSRASSSFKVRAYDNYQQYIEHQTSKLTKLRDQIADYDVELEELVYNRFKDSSMAGGAILCLAARLGGEVRGFRRCGALAIGIDLNPGGASQYVLQGDFHSLAFPDSVFDIVFSNSIDHSIDPRRMISEASRVLKVGGSLILDIGLQKPGGYEAIDIRDSLDEVKLYCKNEGLEVVSEESVEYRTGFVSWDGITLVSVKTENQ